MMIQKVSIYHQLETEAQARTHLILVLTTRKMKIQRVQKIKHRLKEPSVKFF